MVFVIYFMGVGAGVEAKRVMSCPVVPGKTKTRLFHGRKGAITRLVLDSWFTCQKLIAR
jgi:hypothetical protein